MKLLSEKLYVYLLLALLVVSTVVGAGIAHHLYKRDIAYTENDTIRHYQMQKLHTHNDYELIVVGDSSGGNAFDAQLCSTELGITCANLALTGSFGLAGDYNMIRHALATQPKLSTVVIIHTLDVWERPFSMDGYASTLYDLPQLPLDSILVEAEPIALTQYTYNPKEIYWYLKHQISPRQQDMTIANDFLEQRTARFTPKEPGFNNRFIDPTQIKRDKLAMLQRIDTLCEKNNLTCLYISGPVHDAFIRDNSAYINVVLTEVAKSEHIITLTDLTPLPPEKIGDSYDHTAPEYKSEITELYINRIRPNVVAESSNGR